MNYSSYDLKIKFPLLFLIITFACLACRTDQAERKPISKVSTLAGLSEKFGEPFGVAERGGEVFASDGEAGVIRKIAADGASSVFSSGHHTPSQIVFDANGDLLVADSGTHTIKRIKPGGEIETIAGVENSSGFQNGDARTALFNAPVGIAVFENKIFVADTYNDAIRVIENGNVSTVAGGTQGFAEGIGAAAKFDTPCGIAAASDGKIIVADTGNRRLRLIEANGSVSTLAGNGNSVLKDGFLFEAELVQPTAVAINKSGEIFFADGNAIRVIRRVVLPFIETISGTDRGFADGSMRAARFNRPSGLAIGESGNLYVADSENQVLRVFAGETIGKEISMEESRKLRHAAEEFRRLAPPRWTYDPPEARRDIAGTLGELRGEVDGRNKPVWFHNGLDIAGNYGETARFIRDEKVLKPIAAENFNTLRELVRMPTIGYIHIRLGRDKNNLVFNDRRFQFSFDEARKPKGVRIPRGSRFAAGEAIGTLNAFNHVHLIAGRAGAEMNALDALILPNISDAVTPFIEKVSLFGEDWREIETSPKDARITLSGKTRIVVRAFDQMDGNNSRRRLGVYRLGYQILRADETPLGETLWTISFERMPDERAAKFVYAMGSKSGYTPETVFNYIASNRVDGDRFGEDFFDAGQMENGEYVLRVFAADFFGNIASKDTSFEVKK
ncbi:MAG: gluconolaconase [Acidobacteria bacterium]|nr:gluconolaconase [Acidobacteriota bacterium]